METNVESFKSLIVAKHPNGVSSDGRRYSDIPAAELTNMVVSKYPAGMTKDGRKYSDFLKPVRQVTTFEKANLKAKVASENQQLAQEATKNNSILGKIGNFGKAFVSNLAPSQGGLGKTIAKTFGNQSENYAQLIDSTSKSQANLIKLISKNKKEGKDTAKLEGLYAEGQQQLRELGANLQGESNLPTTGQVAGQLGGTALDLLTSGTYGKLKTAGMSTGTLSKANQGLVKTLSTPVSPELGKVADVASGGKGLFTKSGGLSVLKGAGVGYGFDVTQGLQGLRGENRTGMNSLVPGLGTVVGGGIPLAGQLRAMRNPQFKVDTLVAQRQQELSKLDDYVSLKKQTEKGLSRGIDIKRVLSETDVLQGSVDKNGTIHTLDKGGAYDLYRKTFVDGNEAIVSDILKKEGRAIPSQGVEARLRQAVLASGMEGSTLEKALRKIKIEMSGLRRRSRVIDTIPVETIHRAKVDKYSNINFFTDAEKQKYEKTIAKALKEIVEENTTTADVEGINKELSKHFAVLGYLEKLNNKKVEGGKLGKYFAKTVGAIIGSQFGPIGGIVGAEVGGGLKGNLMSRAFGGKTGVVQKEAEIITQAKTLLGEKPLGIGQSSNSVGSLNTNQANTNIPTKNPIPKTLDQTTKKSNRQAGFVQAYKGEKDLTTKILKDLEGKTTVSKQYILDATNRGELKQVERDLIRDIVSKEGDTVNVSDFAKKVKAELLPLKKLTNTQPQYESISLGEDIRGNVKNYSENIYSSPIKTSAGQVHFGRQENTSGYFGHTRIEDMADDKTRRVIEVQSDLYQKGRLENEKGVGHSITRNKEFNEKWDSLTVEMNKTESRLYDVENAVNAKDYVDEAKELRAKMAKLKSDRNLVAEQAQSKTAQELSKLEQYNDPTAHFRMIREEIKKASQDGKTKLQFPTGETAMKIEGLGDRNNWVLYDEFGENLDLTEDLLKVGKEVKDGASHWIITDVLGDGKFKAITKKDYDYLAGKYSWDELSKDTQNQLRGREFNETFDISGKVDTNNPIYKFYEKDVQKYLNKFGGKRIVDDKGVSWIEVPIKKEWGKMPVEAFGKIARSPLGVGAVGFAGIAGGRKLLTDKKEK